MFEIGLMKICLIFKLKTQFLTGGSTGSAPIESSFSAHQVMLSNPDDTDDGGNDFPVTNKTYVRSNRFRWEYPARFMTTVKPQFTELDGVKHLVYH